MSYAEQLFNLNQSKVLNFADNLAWFGKQSYVYSNPDMMKEVISSHVALQNPLTALYAYIWARENGLNASTLFQKGLVIGIYNANVGETYLFKLYQFNSDGSADFITWKCGFASPAVSANDGGNYASFLKLEDYDIVRYLNGGVNWFENWESKPSGVSTASAGNTKTFWDTCKKLPGFMTGISDDVQSMMKTFKGGQNIKICPVSYADINQYIDKDLKLENFVKVDSMTVRVMNKLVPGLSVGNLTPGKADFWSALLEDVTPEQISRVPGIRGCLRMSGAMTVEQSQTDGTVVQIGSFSNFNLKIRM